MGFDQDIPAPIWPDNLRVGGEGCEVAQPADESSPAVDSIAALIRRQHLFPADVVTLLNAISGRMADFNGHLKINQQIVDELDHLSDWISDEVKQ
jgi:hypothetical protein